MFRYFHNRRAQVNTSEYVLVFFVVMTVITAMTVYFKRGVQAKMYSTHNFAINRMIQDLKDSPLDKDSFVGDLYYQYDPYYLNTESVKRHDIQDFRGLQKSPTPDKGSGVAFRGFDHESEVTTGSDTKPPRDVDY
jgi:predicted membrane protein